jgi:hypothetical protein
VQLGTGAVQSVRRPSEASGVCNLNDLLRDCCCRECAESKGVQHLKVFEGLPQGVPAGVFLKDLKSWKTSEGFEPSKSSKGSKRLSALKN